MRLFILLLLLLLGILAVSQWHSLSEEIVRQPMTKQETMAELPIISSSDALHNLPSNLVTSVRDDEEIVEDKERFEEKLTIEEKLALLENLPPLLIDDEAGQQIRAIGTYQQRDVRYRPTPPPKYRGHAIVVFDDGGFISLYPTWHPDAIRPEDEIGRFEGRRVIVTGRAVSVAHPPDGRAGRIDSSFLSLDSIELAPLEQFNSQENEG